MSDQFSTDRWTSESWSSDDGASVWIGWRDNRDTGQETTVHLTVVHGRQVASRTMSLVEAVKLGEHLINMAHGAMGVATFRNGLRHE